VIEPDPDPKPRKSRLYRDRDEKLYLAFAGYCAVVFLLVKLSYGSIGGYLLTATALPIVTLIALICFQVASKRRVSPLAFVLVFAGILLIACWCLFIAAEASAAV
jgi:lipopolysaccharide export LptBFGC system permease protein LptF